MLLVHLTLAASAHPGLVYPPPRYPSDGNRDNKACPCGVSDNDETCSGPTRSDPNRSTTVTVLQAGQPLSIEVHEVIGHTGRWRVAFDPDGADLDDFNANVLLDVADTPGDQGNVGQGDLWVFDVTLPDVACTNCTLQVLQVMNGNQADPVPDPTGQSTYWQCADVELVGDPGDTADPGDTDTDTDTDDTDTDTDTDTDGTPSGTDSPGTADTGAGKGGGCGCAASPGTPWGLLVAGVVVRRRRRAAR